MNHARLRQLRDAVPPGGFLRGALTIIGGTGAAQLISILGSPVLTRLYKPEDYGAYAVAAALLTLLVSVAALRYELAIPLPKSDGEAANVLGLCLLITVALSLATVPLLLIVGADLLEAAGASVLSPYILLVALGVLGGGIVAACTGWMIRSKSYSTIAANRLIQSGAVTIAQIGLGLLSAGGPGLLLASVVGGFAGLGGLARTTWRGGATSFRAITRAGVSGAASRYQRFPIFSAPSIFLMTLGVEAPLLLVVALYGTGVGGHLAFAQRIVALPVAILAAAVGQVYFAEAARLKRERPAELRGLFLKTTRSLAFVAIGPFVLAALGALLLFGVLFGEEWKEAGVYVAILAPAYYLQFVTWPTGGTLDVLERQDLHLIREIGRVCLVAGAVLVAANVHLEPIGAIAALSLSSCIIYVAYGLLSWRAIVGHDRQSGIGPAASSAGRA